MFIVYPSNRLEYLASLLFALLKEQRGSVLAAHNVIVESHGIRHWLQLYQAQETGIAMNLKFQMPSGFIWDLARQLLDEPIPRESPYGESTLVWRIDVILASESFQQEPAAERPTRYWLSQSGEADLLKRYQLAARLASLFEQYIKFRDNWIAGWDNGQVMLDSEDAVWQMRIWQRLIEQPLADQANLHPVALQHKLIDRLAGLKHRLPKDVILFGLNTLPGPSMAFFSELAKHTRVHFFHLNPCVEYWGDIRSDRALAKEMRNSQWRQWLALDEEAESVNPLLANLGQQGKRFFNELQRIGNCEISAFDLPPEAGERTCSSEESGVPVLQRIQRDILTLSHPSGGFETWHPADDSIQISSAHNTLREIQALHDYLLHQINDDATLRPGDMLIMCPDIEEYAPYIDAVFRRPWQMQQNHEPPRLPCSIADRILLEEEPLIAAFLELLTLPDSRFEVSKILDYLRVPAIQNRFGLDVDSLEIIEWWLKEACVHWGLDASHKQQMAGLDKASDTYTWHWALERLLMGYAWGDEPVMLRGRYLMPHVEGQAAMLLGNTLLLLSHLQGYARELSFPRTPAEWRALLEGMTESLFLATDSEGEAQRLLLSVIDQLGADTSVAEYRERIPLTVVRAWFSRQFSRPDSGNHFMTGQVTFCSMMPMRSIPFRVIGVLGLNDGIFPRQENPLSFDLLRQDELQPGDRSRRSDDRYLFLETLISVREKLYLSYQGRSSKNNEARQPSLVLKELMSYLEKYYGWPGDQSYLRQQTLQPFSSKNFEGERGSFDHRWARLAKPFAPQNNRIRLTPMPIPEDPVNIEELIRFYDDPLRWLAENRLGFSLAESEAGGLDAEPFELDSLGKYGLLHQLGARLEAGQAIAPLVEEVKAAGIVPETPITDSTVTLLAGQAQILLNAVSQTVPASCGRKKDRLEARVAGVPLYAEVVWLEKDRSFLLSRIAKCKPKDELRHWLYHLVVQVALEQQSKGTAELRSHLFTYREKDFGEIRHASYGVIPDAQAMLENFVRQWLQGSETPSLLHLRAFKSDEEESELSTIRRLENVFETDAYWAWFMGNQYPFSGHHIERLSELYSPMYSPEVLTQDPLNAGDFA